MISVVVPFRNASRWLRPCIEGLLVQEFDPGQYEIIAVNNASTDDSVAIVNEFPSVRLVDEPRVGSYTARNCGVGVARGSILAFTDADCISERDWLSEFMGAFENPTVGVVLGQRIPASDSSILALWSRYELTKEEFVFTSGDPSLLYGHTNNMAIRRSVFDSCGPFVERMRGSDTIFVHHVAEALGTQAIRFRPSARVRHLELKSIAALLGKLFIYGRSSRLYGYIVDSRSLTFAERWRVFRSTVARYEISFPWSAALLGFLGIGVSVWMLGSESVRLFLRKF